jgi:chemotaxis-related protein WspB
MLFFLFQLGADRYALEASRIAEIIPLVGIKRIPHAPACIAGELEYRGKPVPVIDVSQLALGSPARQLLSTRIVLVHYPDESGATHLLGLMVERATETLRREPRDFVATGVANTGAPYLGPVASDARGLIQWIEVPALLPAPIRQMLFA